MFPTVARASLLLAFYVPYCAPVREPIVAPAIELGGLWEQPADLASRDLYHGSWGQEHAPEPFAVYTVVEHKHTGTNPGMTVIDERGRQWSVKQPPLTGEAPEGPIEVVLSRVLEAIGYHQPPVYYMPSFVCRDDWGTHLEAGGRFRVKDPSLKDRGEWSWQNNPFIGTRPYQGLLVVLLLFNSSDLKNANNTLYEHRTGDLVEPWYVVRDLGTSLGETGRWAPRRGDAARLAASPFITGTRNGFVVFAYRGWHQELVRQRITTGDVRWAAAQLAGLSDRQWRDAFLAGGFTPAAAQPFLDAIQSRITRAASVGAAGLEPSERSR